MLHPIALMAATVGGVLVLVLPRQRVLLPVLYVSMFIPIEERIVIADLDFYLMRIVLLCAFIRMFVGGEWRIAAISPIDKLVVAWVLCSMGTYILLWKTGGAVVNRLGFAYNVLGIYFVARAYIRSFEDIERILRSFIAISAIVALAMIYEAINGRNLFAAFGGVPEHTLLRDGELRCQGPFAHPILAGSFGAAILPIGVSLMMSGNELRRWGLIGAVAGMVIVLTSSSSGPVIASLGGMVALGVWPYRRHLRLMRWGTLLGLVGLHIIMKAPVWALVARVEVFGASTGYHRYLLIDQFISRIGEWWLMGVKSTAGWGYYLFDVTNMFIRVAVNGGIVSLLLFCMIIAYCFNGVGIAVRVNEGLSRRQLVVWGLGATLFSNTVSFMGVAYFDQIIVMWYTLHAMIVTASASARANESVRLNDNHHSPQLFSAAPAARVFP